MEAPKNKINKNKNGEKFPHLEIIEVVLVHCNIVNNEYQRDSRVFYTYVPKKSFGQLLDISLDISEFSYIEVWFTYQTSEALEEEDKINITLVIN